MAAIAFDTLKFARRLIEAGVPIQQSEAQAEVMAESFVYNIDSLATKDYLDARLDARFAAQDARMDIQFAKIGGQFKLVYWILAVLIASVVVPQLSAWAAT